MRPRQIPPLAPPFNGRGSLPLTLLVTLSVCTISGGAERLECLGTMYASPVGAAGRVYIANRNGATLVIEHGEKFKVLATNKLDERFSASPIVVGRQLLLRGEEHLYSILDEQ